MSGIGQISGDSGLTNKALKTLTANADNAQDKLKELFKAQYFNNGQTGINDIEEKIKEVEKLIKATEDEIDELNKKIDESNGKIDDATDILDKIVVDITKETDEYQKSVEEKIRDAMNQAVMKTKSDTGRINGKNDEASASSFAENFKLYFRQNGGDSLAPNVSGLFDQQEEVESDIQGYIDNIDKLIKENGLLCNKMQNAKSTITLLNATKDNLTAQKEGYTNSDTNSNIPIYSPAKETFVDEKMADYSTRFKDSTGPTDIRTSTSTTTTHGETSTAWTTTTTTTTTYIDPTKTVSGNNQVSELQKAVTQDNLLKEFKNKDFTFKETMYALQKMFPKANLEYNLANQNGQATYSLAVGDDAQTKAFYDSFASQVKSLWGINAKRVDPPKTSSTSHTTSVAKPRPRSDKNDPIGFKMGDTSYEFLTLDAIDNGKFDGLKEMLGSTNGMDELKDMAKTLGASDGVIKGEDALKQVIVMEMKHVKQPDGSTKLEPAFTNAWDLGIREIDTNGRKKTDQDGSGYTNINDADVENTFDIKMKNGKVLTGEQKYETQDYINTVYSKGFGENIFSKLNDDYVDSVFKQNVYTNSKAEQLQINRDIAQGALDASDSAISQDDIDELVQGKSERVDNAIGAGFYQYKKSYEHQNKGMYDDVYGNKGVISLTEDIAIEAFRNNLKLDSLDDFSDMTNTTQEEALEDIKKMIHPETEKEKEK